MTTLRLPAGLLLPALARSAAGGSGFGFNQAPMPASAAAGGLAAHGHGFDASAGGGGSNTAVRDEIGIGQADLEGFEQRLKDVQAAWTKQDLAQLRRLAT